VYDCAGSQARNRYSSNQTYSSLLIRPGLRFPSSQTALVRKWLRYTTVVDL